MIRIRSGQFRFLAQRLNFLGVVSLVGAVMPLMGVRFIEHQGAIGLLVGVALIYLSDRLVRYAYGPAHSAD